MVKIYDEPLQEKTGIKGMFCVRDAFAQGKHMKYTEYSLPYSRSGIEVTSMADGSFWGYHVVRSIRTHVPATKLV
jgi:hypothetical protein